MANNKIKGLTITGRLKESGITVYIRNGKPVARTATSWQPKNNQPIGKVKYALV